MSMTLHVEDDNKTYDIVEWQHKFHKEIDSLGRSITKPIFTEFIIKLDPDHFPELVAWAAAPYLLKKRVYIIEDPTQSKGRLITTEFVDVKCTTYEITMEGIFLEFAAAGYCREHVVHTAYWKESLFKHEMNSDVTEREVEEEQEAERSTMNTMEDEEDSVNEKDNMKTDDRPSLKTPKSIIDVPNVPNPTQTDGIIYPDLPKVPEVPKGKLPELSEDALKNIPENMQKVITDYPDDVLPDAKDEGMRQDIIIAAANPKDSNLQEKGVSAGQALLGKAITVVAIAGTAYGLYKSGKQMVQQIESAGKFLKKIF